MEPPTALPPPLDTPRPPARRSTQDRLLGGVSTATARYLGVSLTATRILYVAAALVGGLGIVLYVVAWLFVPDDQQRVVIQGDASSPKESLGASLACGLAMLITTAWITGSGPSWLASILVTAGVFVMSRRGSSADGLVQPPEPAPSDVGPAPGAAGQVGGSDVGWAPDASTTGVLPVLPGGAPVLTRTAPGPRSSERLAPAPAPRPPKPAAFLGPLTVSIAVALAGSLSILHALGAIELRPSDVLIAVLVVVGLGLLISTWFGRARGLILLGLLLVPAVAISAVVDRIDLRGGTGERVWSPRTAGELQDRYRLGAGSLQLDMTRLDTSTVADPGGELRTDLSLGTGSVMLVVPQDWTLHVRSTVELGTVWLYSDGRAVPEGELPDELRTGEVRWDLFGTGSWYFAEREKVPDDPGDDGGRRTLQLPGEAGAPVLDVDISVTAGVVEVFRVAS